VLALGAALVSVALWASTFTALRAWIWCAALAGASRSVRRDQGAALPRWDGGQRLSRQSMSGGGAARFGVLLRAHRRAAGLTQQQLADLAEVSVGTLRDLEQGRTRHPRPGSAARLAAAIGLDASQAEQLPQQPWVRAARVQEGAAVADNGRGVARSRAAADGVWLQVLGPLAAWRGGVPVALGTPKQRAALGLLALEPNALVHRETIIDAVWGADPPVTAVNMVQTHTGRLRRALDPGRSPRDPGGLLASVGTGYRLQVTAGQLDLLSFEQLVGRAGAACSPGDGVAACDLYERALKLWQGEPLADVDVLRGHPAVLGLGHRRTAVITAYAQTAIKIGLHERVLPHLEALTQREPLNEQAHAQLMLALAGSGQQAAALQLYQELRRRLDDQLGVRPGPGLADAHLRVLRQEVPAAAPSSSATPVTPVTPATSVAPAASGTTAVLAQTVLPVCQLPPDVADFTGRAQDCARLTALLAPTADTGAGNGSTALPVGVISGPPGAGKTTLALHVAHALRPAFPDGQLFVPLAGSSRPRRPGEVLDELLRALGVAPGAIPGTAGQRAALFRSRLAGRRVLVVVDDAGSPGQVRPLLPGTAGCAVMVTSRNRLAGLGGATPIPLDCLPHGEAVELLGRIAGVERVAGEPAAADGLVAACGRLPLALRITGARLAARPGWPLARLAGLVADADPGGRLDALVVDDLAVRASVASSYRALDGRARRAFGRLSLVGPQDVAEWVVAALLGEPDAAEVVNLLVDKSLLTLAGVEAGGEPRYRLHDLLRDYAAERLAEEPQHQRDAALERVLSGWLQLAGLADRGLPREPTFPPPQALPIGAVIPDAVAARLTADPVAWFSAERLNLLAATRRACEPGRGQHGLAARLASCQLAFQDHQARSDDAEHLWQAVLAAASTAGDLAAAAHARLRLAIVTIWRGRCVDAQPLLEECGAAFEEAADTQALAYCLSWRSYCAGALGNFHDAHQHAERALTLARQAGDRNAEQLSLQDLGVALARLGEPDAAAGYCQQALATARQLADPICEYLALSALAKSRSLAGDHAQAMDLAQQALKLMREIGYSWGQARCLTLLGSAYHGLGRHRDAIDVLARALPVYERCGARRQQAGCLLRLGHAHQALGHHRQATQYLQHSLAISRELRLNSHQQQAVQALQKCHAGPGRSTDPAPSTPQSGQP
jgi:DNA-binding SARP family transcriptional activator/tetratricopeptide (TPR) repeat protein/transcriptional regulator with XRE-family HTH domain